MESHWKRSEGDQDAIQLGKFAQERLYARALLITVRDVLEFNLGCLDAPFDQGPIDFLGRNGGLGGCDEVRCVRST